MKVYVNLSGVSVNVPPTPAALTVSLVFTFVDSLGNAVNGSNNVYINPPADPKKLNILVQREEALYLNSTYSLSLDDSDVVIFGMALE